MSSTVYIDTLGTLDSGDYLFYLASGQLVSQSADEVAANWTQVSDSSTLTGSDWN